MASNSNEVRTRNRTEKGKAYASETLKRDIKKKKIKLSNQISLFEDLLKTRNVEMVKTELNKLEILVNELKSLVDSLLDVVDRKEIESWMNMMAKEQGKVIEVGDRVEKWLVAEGSREASSGCTRTSRLSRTEKHHATDC